MSDAMTKPKPKAGATRSATALSITSTLDIFVHERVNTALRSFGLAPIELAALVSFDSLVPPPVIAEMLEDPGSALRELRPVEASASAELTRRVRAVCAGPVGEAKGTRLTEAVPDLDWAALDARGRLSLAIALAGKDRKVLAWVPYQPTTALLEGHHRTETVAILSARGIIQPIVVDGTLLQALSERPDPRVELRLEVEGDAVRQLWLDLRGLRRGAKLPRHAGEAHAHPELPARWADPRSCTASLRVPDLRSRDGRAVERREFLVRVAQLHAVPYDPLDSEIRERYYAWCAAQYDDSWTGPGGTPLWEPGLEQPPNAPGFAVALWAAGREVRFGRVSLACEAELAWHAAGGRVTPLLETREREELRPSAVERFVTEWVPVASGMTAGIDAVVTVSEWAKYGTTRDTLRKSLKPLFTEAFGKADALVRRSAGVTGVPATARAFLRKAKGRWGDVFLKELELVAKGSSASEGAHVLEAVVAARRYSGALDGARILKVASAAGDVLSGAGLGLAAVARAVLGMKQDRAETVLDKLLKELDKDAWLVEDATLAALAATDIEHVVAEVPTADLELFLAAVGVAATVLSWTPLAPIGLALDALLLAQWAISTGVPDRPKPPERLGRLARACLSRFLVEAFALAFVTDGVREGALAHGGRIARSTLDPAEPVDVPYKSEIWSTAIDRAALVAARHGIRSRRDTVLREGFDVPRLVATEPCDPTVVRHAFERSTGFWLRRLCVYALALNGLGQRSPGPWYERLKRFLWKGNAEIAIDASEHSIDVVAGGRKLAFEELDLFTMFDTPVTLSDFVARVVPILRSRPLVVTVDTSAFSSPWSVGDPASVAILERITMAAK